MLESAASGLPIVATRDGGPVDIVRYCRNGVLIDPLDVEALGRTLYEALSDERRWRAWSKAGISGAKRHFTWDGHAISYLREVHKRIGAGRRRPRAVALPKSRLPVADRILVCDIDNTLIGDRRALDQLLQLLRESSDYVGFGVATGRSLDSAIRVLREWRVPPPDFLISAAGGEIHYGARLVEDESWKRHIDYRWEPERVRACLQGVRGLRPQSAEGQRRFKVSYFIDTATAPSLRELRRRLRQIDIHANAICSYQAYLDLLPMRASKGAAMRYLADKWGIPIERVLAAGDAGNDEEMLSGETLGVVVGNHSAELERLRGRDSVYFARAGYSSGILEGIAHYDFIGAPKGRITEVARDAR